LAQDKPVTLAAIAGAHGVTGEVRLKLFGEGATALKRYKSFNDGALTLKSARDDNKGGAIVRFAEIADRTAAERLRGTLLTVSRSALPALEEGEYYHADLIGLSAVSDAGDEPAEVTGESSQEPAEGAAEEAPAEEAPAEETPAEAETAVEEPAAEEAPAEEAAAEAPAEEAAAEEAPATDEAEEKAE
jgi:16S rRNA processing protein RimM